MAEEDEIDVLGDFNLDHFLVKNDSSIYGSASLVSQNTEFLNCDYTIHPQWLLDKPSANPDNWYGSNISTGTGLLEKTQIESDTLGHVSTENSITDESGWTEKEKNLLERGIEIFGKSNVRLSQFIGSKTASEVKYYLKNFYQENQTAYKNFNDGVVEEVSDSNLNLVSDILDDTQIPASIEEVIAAVSTAKPTIQIHKRSRKKSSSVNTGMGEVNLKNIPSGQSLLKSNYVKTDSHSVRASKIKKLESHCKQRKHRTKSTKCKFKTKSRMSAKENKTQIKQKTSQMRNERRKKTEFSKVEITTGEGLAVPICEGEEIVKIKNVDNDSDLDVEIDVEDTDEEIEGKIKHTFNFRQVLEQTEPTQVPNAKSIDVEPRQENIESKIKKLFDLSTLDDSTVKELMSLDEPKKEIVLDENNVTELEKVIHSEYFEGKPAKTPERYLQIRNHIINSWIWLKPNYVTKTSIRLGLKNCGDVNSIGRIHYFLEQVGAINFGCAQMNYIRPLYDMVQIPPVVKEKAMKDNKNENKSIKELGSRPRYKKKFTNDGEGGCTLTHDEKGRVINTTVVNEEPVVKQKIYVKKPMIRLIYCRPFTEDKPQPYTVKIHLSTLLTMDFHAHTSLTEVMGLTGGHWIPQDKILTISHYEPCLNIASSATHCDMCPISQAKAAETIHSKGLDILGWFHSHPTFAPEPSHQDIETQQVLQQWVGHNKPCIGIILSPFSLNGALISSPFRCMVVDKKFNFEDQIVPYKFKVELISEDFDVNEFLRGIREMVKKDVGCAEERKVKLNKPYFQDSSISYVEKYITSVRMHLAKCGKLPKMTCDMIIEGISDICSYDMV